MSRDLNTQHRRIKEKAKGYHAFIILLSLLLINLITVYAPCLAENGSLQTTDETAPGIAEPADNKNETQTAIPHYSKIYPEITADMRTEDCMQCHPSIAAMLRTSGGRHGHVECRQCHLQVHSYIEGQTTYSDILPKCQRCHDLQHGKELSECSSCHVEAHSPLQIPASRPLSQGCYVCHAQLDKDIKIFPTKHTDLYCIACHHTKHGYKPNCLECHQPHTGQPRICVILHQTNRFDKCTTCHPPHKALKVNYPQDTPNELCSYCHRKAKEMLQKSDTKHSYLLCTKCHPDQHKTIKRCKECHGKPHPDDMLKKFGSCGTCHGVAHSVVR